MSASQPSNRERNGYLETIGRKSGQARETEFSTRSPGVIVILSGYNNDKDWVKNSGQSECSLSDRERLVQRYDADRRSVRTTRT
ncbi:MAG: hypothetical protein R2843_06370 [Thermomicrobiales bacterium]